MHCSTVLMQEGFPMFQGSSTMLIKGRTFDFHAMHLVKQSSLFIFIVSLNDNNMVSFEGRIIAKQD